MSHKLPEGEARLRRMARTREYYNRNPTAARRAKLARAFGITEADYDRMWEAQGGLCAICHLPEPVINRCLAVDHNHITKQVRALLCSRCNPMLGYAHDSPDRLRAAAAYLETY